MTNLTTPFELINPLDFDAVIDGLQKENSAFRSANETLLKTSLNQEKENVDLKVRLKNCLNHDSLIGTRSELNKKDGQIIDLQNSRKELKAELLEAAELIEGWSDMYSFDDWNRVEKYRKIVNKELDDD